MLFRSIDEPGDGRTVGAFADLVDGVIARLWVITTTALDATAEPGVAVARDDFMSQLRQRCQGDATDHPELQMSDWHHVLELGSAALDALHPPSAASSSQVWVMRAFSSGESLAALYRLRVQAATRQTPTCNRLAMVVAHVHDQTDSGLLHPGLALSAPLPEPATVLL